MTDKQKKDANDAMNSMAQSKFKRGGAVKSMKHDDAKEDRAMIKSMVKPSAIKRAAGGKVMMTAGSESGEGRLQKSKMAKG